MLRKSAFIVEGTVVDILSAALFTVQLANGHCLVGHVPRRQKLLTEMIKVNDAVAVRLSPCDLSQGRLILNKTNYESSGVCKKNVRALQNRETQRRDSCDLQ